MREADDTSWADLEAFFGDVVGIIDRARVLAAEVILSAAVERAARNLRPVAEMRRLTSPNTVVDLERRVNEHVVAMLTAAGESAALLLDERPAKKAAARKGAS